MPSFVLLNQNTTLITKLADNLLDDPWLCFYTEELPQPVSFDLDILLFLMIDSLLLLVDKKDWFAGTLTVYCLCCHVHCLFSMADWLSVC